MNELEKFARVNDYWPAEPGLSLYLKDGRMYPNPVTGGRKVDKCDWQAERARIQATDLAEVTCGVPPGATHIADNGTYFKIHVGDCHFIWSESKQHWRFNRWPASKYYDPSRMILIIQPSDGAKKEPEMNCQCGLYQPRITTGPDMFGKHSGSGNKVTVCANCGRLPPISEDRQPLNTGTTASITDWDGKGMPPIGTVCEIAASTEYLKISHPEGAKVKIYAHFTDDRNVNLAAFVDPLGKFGGVCTAECFRPIRSDEDLAVEAMLLLDPFDQDQRTGMMSRENFCRALYRAGFRKGDA